MKRSSAITLAVMGAYVAGIAWWYREPQSLVRNRYASWDDCSCDYSTTQCSFNKDGLAVGPWYLEDADLRMQDSNDPGPGGRCERTARLGGYGSGGGSRPLGVEYGHRGGFGQRASLGRVGG